jgi:hypothetical protein
MISTPKNTPVSGALNAAEILTDPQLRRDLNAAEICDPAGAISFTLHQPGAYDMLARIWLQRAARACRCDAEERGPGQALLMTMAGRRDGVSELSGPGQVRLAGRIDG